METIKNYLENMFSHLPNTPEVQKAKYELYQMMEDKYNELISEGKSDNEAIGIVIAVECSIFGFKASSVSCRILTNEAHSYNDFDCPDRVSITEHTAVIKDNVLKLNIPPCAVVECVVD